MAYSISVLALAGEFTLALFLGLLNLYFWRFQRYDRTSLWLGVWVMVVTVISGCRLLQYAPLSEAMYIVIPRIMLSAAFSLAWVGYELANEFIAFRPPRRERAAIILLVAIPILLLWASDLILTREVILRTVFSGGQFHGVTTGPLYVPAALLILGLGLVPVLRLLRAPGPNRKENRWMAWGFLCAILFSLNDFIATALNFSWIRLSDYSYLPLAIFFTYIQAQRFGLLYKKLDLLVQERTSELSQVNETLRTEIIQRRQADEELRRSEERYRRTLDHMLEGCQIIGYDWRYLYVNDAVATQGRQARENSLGRTMMDVYPGIENTEMFATLQRCMQGRLSARIENKFTYPDGDEAWFDLSVQPVPEGIFIVSVDITYRKHSEEDIRRHANELTVLHEITHDLVIEQNLSKLLHTIVERAAAMLKASGGGLYLCEPEHEQVRCVVSYHTGRDYTGVVLKYGEGAAGYVAQTGEPLIIPDYRVWGPRAAVYEPDQPFVSVLSVPMRWQDRLIGIIHVLENARERTFTKEDMQLLTLFADQAAIAVENARLFESEERRRQEAAVIAEVGRDISASLQLDVVLERIAEHAQALLGAETSAVYLYEPEKPCLRAIAARGPDSEEIKQDYLCPGEGILGNIAQQEAGEIVNYTSTDPRAITVTGTECLLDEHLMGVPILFQEQLTGLIAVWRSGIGQEFNAEDLDFLSSLAHQAAIAIANARLFEAEKYHRQQAETLRDASQRITATLDQEQAIQLILDQLAKVVAYKSASVQLLGDGYLEIIGGKGWPVPSAVLGLRFPVPGNNPNTEVIHKRQPVIIGNALQLYSAFGEKPHNHIQSWLGVPLIVRDRVIGMFAVDHSEPNFFTEADAQMVNAFAGQAAIAIENARLFEDTRKRLSEIEAVHTVSTALRSAQTLHEALPIILYQLMDLMNAGAASLELIDTDTGEIVTELACGAWTPVTGLRTPPNIGISGRIIATGEPYVSNDVISDGRAVRPDLFGGITMVACVPVIAHHQPIGALWIGRHTPFLEEEVSLLAAIGEMVGNAIQRIRLHEQAVSLLDELQVANRELYQAYDTTLAGWAKALELRDKETEGHSRRVTDLTLQLARAFGIPDAQLTHIRRGILLHDIGKMGVSDQILKKPGPLDEQEWTEMRMHPQYAYDLIYPIAYLRPALDIPYYHHEKWDGTGYPQGLKGEEIPLAARIFAVVDVYDALSSNRPYRSAWDAQSVLGYLQEQAGKHFDPQVVEAFLVLIVSQQDVTTSYFE